jgi:hypothetical protein
MIQKSGASMSQADDYTTTKISSGRISVDANRYSKRSKLPSFRPREFLSGRK